MRINRRERIYLLVLLLVVIGFLGYKFGYTPYADYMSNLESEYDDVKTEYDNFKISLEFKPGLTKKIEDYNKILREKSKGYVYEIRQEELILKLDKLFVDNEINISGLTFSDISDLMLLEESDISTDKSIKKLQMTLGFSAEYESMLNFIDDMQAEPNKISISNLVIVSGEGGIINGTMNLEFYSVKNEFTLENDYKWEDIIEYGKDNPFDSSHAGGNYNIMANKTYDFLMDLRPTSSDLPTVTVQKIGSEINSSIFGESNSAIDVKITVIEEDGVYKYKYEAGVTSYPTASEYLEFDIAESNSIGLKIFSNDRNSDVDTSGAKITIDNQTDLEFNLYILGDDKIRPRAVFTNTGGVNIVNE